MKIGQQSGLRKFNSLRIEHLNEKSVRQKGRYVLYWMQQAQRIQQNHALSHAMNLSDELGYPLLVVFVISPGYPNANLRHYRFMLQGIKVLEQAFLERGICFKSTYGNFEEIINELSKEAVAMVFDKGYLAHERRMRATIASQTDCEVTEVDTNCIVPVSVAYPKEAYAAYAIRPAIMRSLSAFMDFQKWVPVTNQSEINFEGIDVTWAHLGDVEEFIRLKLSHLPDLSDVSNHFIGGEAEALRRTDAFIDKCLLKYSAVPDSVCYSKLSPYLHFGQISSLEIYRRILASGFMSDDYVEQLVVRRELAINFVYYNKHYKEGLDQILPAWAFDSLMEHVGDVREIYSLEAIELGQTEDDFFNRAQLEMVTTGHMNSYMRMYWGKKVLEWSKTPKEAFERLIYLNDKYELDGRDANGYTGIAWIFGKHDRPWRERAIFGKIRYMNAQGLKRKFDMEKYYKL